MSEKGPFLPLLPHKLKQMKKNDFKQDYDLLLSRHAALEAAVVDFANSLQKIGLLEPESTSVRILPKLLFNTDYGKRHDIMMYFVEMMSKGLIENTEKSLIEFLSEMTNLGPMSAIKNHYYRCQREYVR